MVLESTLGCDSLLLVNITKFGIYFPNIFSPNQDGINDLFYPIDGNQQITSYELLIYDRWGNLLHKGQEWDGNKELEIALEGTYTYQAKIRFFNESVKDFYGAVTLVR